MRIPKRTLALGLTGLVLIALLAAASFSFHTGGVHAADGGGHDNPGEESSEIDEAINYFFDQRLAPNGVIPAEAWPAAVAHANGMSLASATADWTEIGPYNYQSDNPNYIDPNFSNSGAGNGFVSGRITSLAALSDGHTVFTGAADGGVWKWTDASGRWTPVFDGQDSMATGALAIDEISPSSYTVYVGTGEGNFGYTGVGVLRSTDGGASWTPVGDSKLLGSVIFRIAIDHANNRLYVASSKGLFRCALSSCASWQAILGGASTPPNALNFANFVTDVILRPGHSGDVIAARGWIFGAPTNGLYESTDGGDHFTTYNPQGYPPLAKQGRVSLAYSADGNRLYAIVQDPSLENVKGAKTVFAGIFVSRNGDPHGPFNQIADSQKLMNSGSAMKPHDIGTYYQPGIQADYNQFIAVDPANPDHVYAGLEEVYETTNGGTNWTALGPYWNFPFSCFSYNPFPGTCASTTHSDQHAVVIAAGKVWVGNDGGVWSRALSAHSNTPGSWTDLNRTLNTLQFYNAGGGMTNGHLTLYGGLQDNGTAKVVPDTGEAAQPFGGDGGDVVVDPNNGDNVITEYINLRMAKSRDGGRHWTGIGPSDPNPQFIAPFTMDSLDSNRLLAGGQFVWQSTKGFDTECNAGGCDWTPVYNFGAGNTTTAVQSAGGVIYAAWCGPCSPSRASGLGFKGGMASNVGGTWHAITPPGAIQDPATGNFYSPRYISGIAIDSAHPEHVYATLSGFSRTYLTGPLDPGVGHVFESTDGGTTWTNISGVGASAMIDAPANDIVVANGHLVVGTDLGAYVALAGQGTATVWQRLGTKLPRVVIRDLSLTPNGLILAGTHGRGLWTFPVSALA